MTTYEDQYYLVNKKYDENTLYLTPFEKTMQRRFHLKKIPYGEEPLFFENAFKEKDKQHGISRPLRKAMMWTTFLIVDENIKEDLEQYDINGFQLYPAVVVDDNGNYHEDYWFFNIYQHLDALDTDLSIIDNYNPNSNGHDVEKFKLKTDVLDQIKEENRLIFIMPNTEILTIIAHQKIVDIFNKHDVDSVVFHKMSEWYSGKQFRK
ncbi:imm11 family protein [Bacterioplanoides pacificum]|uniref:Imm11 family protein n=1 Tax=Bacterioplanoides pacificum TaxID=1171596 RepID=A0ABV7VS70_9GAMM